MRSNLIYGNRHLQTVTMAFLLALGNLTAQEIAPAYRSDTIIVKVTGRNGIARLNAELNVRTEQSFPDLGGIQVLRLPEGLSVEEAVARYSQSGEVEYAQPNYLYHLTATNPNDTFFSSGLLWACTIRALVAA